MEQNNVPEIFLVFTVLLVKKGTMEFCDSVMGQVCVVHESRFIN